MEYLKDFDELFDDILLPSLPPIGGSNATLLSKRYVLRAALAQHTIGGDISVDAGVLLRMVAADLHWHGALLKEAQHLLAPVADCVECSLADGIDITMFTRDNWHEFERAFTRIMKTHRKGVFGLLEETLQRIEQSGPDAQLWDPIVILLTDLMKLSPVESALLAYATVHCENHLFRKALASMDMLSREQCFALLAAMISEKEEKCRKALRGSASLRNFKLIQVDFSPRDMEDLLKLDDASKSIFAEPIQTTEELTARFLRTGTPPHLKREDFAHLDQEFNALSRFIEGASRERAAGSHLLLYGPPGTGKTEFARLLAQQLALTAYDIKINDDEGDPVPGRQRLVHFAWSQTFLAGKEKSILIFDEIEDVFPDVGASIAPFIGKGRPMRGELPKAWLNTLLETAPVPAIWICNHLDGIDPAFLRRFSYHLEFRVPPASVRQRVAKNAFVDMKVSEEFLSKLASNETLSPAQITQAARFARLSGIEGPMAEQWIGRVITDGQHAMGDKIAGGARRTEVTPIRLEYCNIESNLPLPKLVAALERTRSGALCLYGAPGTGKTSLANYIAKALDRPLMVRRASDLLSKWVGESEQNIAEMFRSAEVEDAVLLLDEADSFLRNRAQAGRSWEVTQVNELLQHMETFPGVFICATNLMDDVDPAALRRFTFKLKFNPLVPDQRYQMFAELVLGNAKAALPKNIAKQLLGMDTLTPGDFATVRRQENLLA